MADRKGKEPQDFEITFYEGVLKRRPEYIEALIPLAEAYTRKGLYEKGLEMDQRLSKLCKEDPIVHYNLACSYALVGKKKEALKALRRSVELGYCDFAHLRRDPDLKGLHGDPDFDSLASIDR
jgi:tetratricopeptide (TPR) repeat protein